MRLNKLKHFKILAEIEENIKEGVILNRGKPGAWRYFLFGSKR
jgi:hypothetical protein